jgi:hypothetical protein
MIDTLNVYSRLSQYSKLPTSAFLGRQRLKPVRFVQGRSLGNLPQPHRPARPHFSGRSNPV